MNSIGNNFGNVPKWKIFLYRANLLWLFVWFAVRNSGLKVMTLSLKTINTWMKIILVLEHLSNYPIAVWFSSIICQSKAVIFCTLTNTIDLRIVFIIQTGRITCWTSRLLTKYIKSLVREEYLSKYDIFSCKRKMIHHICLLMRMGMKKMLSEWVREKSSKKKILSFSFF